MLPSYFSKILMYLILPAQHQPPTHSRFELTQVKSYSVSHQYISGLETYHAILDHKKDIQLYEVFFPGNAMDIGQVFLDDSGKSYSYIQYYLLNAIEKNKKNFVFWNYPGVGDSQGQAKSPIDLMNAGYLQVMNLINAGVEAKNITLNGFSLGGGVAIAVARKLYEEGHFVHLKVDRSFSSISDFAIKMFSDLLENTYDKSMMSFVVGFVILGLSLGAAIAGLMATLAWILSKVCGSFVEDVMNWVGTAFGLLVAGIGALIGALIGSIVGVFLSLLVNVKCPMKPFITMFLWITGCEINSVHEMKHILQIDELAQHKVNIYVQNSLEDEVIKPSVSLCQGLGIMPGEWHSKIKALWFKKGEHCQANLYEPITP